MALRCEHCNKGRVIGHNVSHAKNRTRRFFKPNLQTLKASVAGVVRSVKLCTRCIKRLKLDGHIGSVFVVKPSIKKTEKPVVKQLKSEPVKELKKSEKKITSVKKTEIKKAEKPVKTLDISSIVGKRE